MKCYVLFKLGTAKSHLEIIRVSALASAQGVTLSGYLREGHTALAGLK
jgi:hypothetical protein